MSLNGAVMVLCGLGIAGCMFWERWPDQRRVKTAFILLNIMFIAWVTNH